MAPFPECEAVIPMSAQEYLVERDSAAFRSLVAEVRDSFALLRMVYAA